MPSNNDLDYLEDLANQIREPNQKLLDEFKNAEKHKILSNKLAIKADKMIIRDSKANRKAMLRRPGGLTGRLTKRAGGAAMGALGGAIGGIPIVGAIFRAIGQEAAATLKDKKTFNKELARQRRIELKLMEKYEAARKKKEERDLAAAEAAANPTPTNGGGAGGGSSAAVEKLSNAAASLEAAAISLTPAIQTFDETVQRIHDVVERLGEHGGPSKITDPAVIEYLHAIEFFTQETAAQVEKLGSHLNSGGFGRGANIGPKALEYLHAIEFYTQESAAQVEKMQSDFPALSKNINLIRTNTWKLSLSSQRIETLLKKAATDRLKQIDISEEQLKLQRKQYDTQEETKFIGLLGILTNLMGSLGGMFGGIGGGLMKAGAVGAAAYGAFEIGKAIGEELAKYLDGNKVFEGFMNRVFDIFDNVLAKMGDPEAQARVKTRDDEAFVQYGQELAKQSGLPQLDPKTEAYLRENHTLPGIDADTFANRGVTGGLFNTSIGAKSKDEMAKLMQNWQMNQAQPALPGQQLIPASAGLEEAKAEAEAKKALRQQAISQNSQVNNNNQTVVPQPLSADPAGGVSKSRNLGD